jgi:regulator of sigma E protease
MHILISIAGVIMTILFVVGTHEAGHFFMARRMGVKVLTFSIGFGKRIWSWHDKTGTEYVLAWIPLGGYVRMLDESEGKVDSKDLHLAYNNQPFYKKFLIVAAGPCTNFLCAVLLYWLIFTLGFVTIKPIIGNVMSNSIASEAGLKPKQQITHIDDQEADTWPRILFKLLIHTGSKDKVTVDVIDPVTKTNKTYTLDLTNWKMNDLNPDPFTSLGFTPFDIEPPLVIGQITPDSAAEKGKLTVGDKLVALDHVELKDWTQMSDTIQAHPDQEVMFSVIRNGKKIELPVLLGSQRSLLLKKYGVLGIAPPMVDLPASMQQKIKYGPLAALPRALQETVDLTKFNLLLFGKMFTGKLSLESLGGPITIFNSAGNSLNYGFLPFISFLAFLSISIGIINILPIPGLDGGHLFIQMIESIMGRPIAEVVINNLYRAGFLFLFFILLHALINDVMRMM